MKGNALVDNIFIFTLPLLLLFGKVTYSEYLFPNSSCQGHRGNTVKHVIYGLCYELEFIGVIEAWDVRSILLSETCP